MPATLPLHGALSAYLCLAEYAERRLAGARDARERRHWAAVVMLCQAGSSRCQAELRRLGVR